VYVTLDTVVSLGREALSITLLVAAPCLGISLAVGFVVSLFQATTQIHDPTLSFVPKIIGVAAGLLVFGAWMLRTLMDYASRLIQSLPGSF